MGPETPMPPPGASRVCRGSGGSHFFRPVMKEVKAEVEKVGGTRDADASSWFKQDVQRQWRQRWKSLLPAGYERGQSGSQVPALTCEDFRLSVGRCEGRARP